MRISLSRTRFHRWPGLLSHRRSHIGPTLLGLADFLPFTLIVGWSVSGYLALFRRPVVHAAAPVVLAAVSVLPSFLLVGGLAKVPPGRRSGLDQGAAFSRGPLFRPPATPRVVLARRHALFYWPEEETRLERRATPGQCRDAIEKGHAVLTTNPRLCGLDGVKVASFRGDAGIHNKHHLEFIFKSDEQG